MKNLYELSPIIEEYNRVIYDAQNHAIFARMQNLQVDQIRALRAYHRKLQQTKKKFIKQKKEFEANLILSFQHGLSAIECELNMLVKLKKGKPIEAWDDLITAQNLTQNVIRNKIFEGHNLLGYYNRLLSYEKLLFPDMHFNSMGGIILESECSICKSDYEDCDHVKGIYYMGSMCSKILTKIDLEEISIVKNPADKRCRITSITNERGQKIDYMTRQVLDI